MPPIALSGNRHRPCHAADSAGAVALGDLPEWNLADLYSAHDAPEVAADLERSAREAAAFEERYKGRLADMAARSGAELAAAIRDMEALDDLMGRLASFAGLFYAGNTTDPVRQKFYGDVQDKLTTASSHLIFFTLELNRIDDAVIEARPAPIRSSPTIAPGSTTSARHGRTSSKTASSSSSTRSRFRVPRPGTASSTRPWPRCASMSPARGSRWNRR